MVSATWQRKQKGLLFLLCILSFVAATRPDKSNGKYIEIALGGSREIRVGTNIERVVVGDPQILEVTPVARGVLLLSAKAVGETKVTVWSKDGTVMAYDIVASLSIAAIERALAEAYPHEEELKVHVSGGMVYLTGKVADINVAEMAGRIARNILVAAGHKTIEPINLLSVAAADQIQVHLKFVEISRTNLRELGFNAFYDNKTASVGLFGTTVPNTMDTITASTSFPGTFNPLAPSADGTTPFFMPMLASPITGSFSLAFSALLGSIPLSATLALLESRNIAKTLSEPTLIAGNGREATFLVGGEFPIPMPSSLGQTLVQWKKYGSQLSFTPTVLAQNTVQLQIESIVSNLDRANGVTIGGTVVPALQSRTSGTSVRLRDGQSFAIAGLLQDQISSNVSKVPVLGDIPVLGLLFRNISNTRQETELVIIVTIHLVHPMLDSDMPKIFAEEEFTNVNNAELYLLGLLEKTKTPKDYAGHLPIDNKNKKSLSGPAGFGH